MLECRDACLDVVRRLKIVERRRGAGAGRGCWPFSWSVIVSLACSELGLSPFSVDVAQLEIGSPMIVSQDLECIMIIDEMQVKTVDSIHSITPLLNSLKITRLDEST